MNACPARWWWIGAWLLAVGCARQPHHDLTDAHALPAHHPRTFHRAVTALNGDTLTTAERLDVIRWLPELAADTTLDRERWEEVTHLAAALAATAAHSPAAEGPLAALQAIDAALPSEERRHDEPAPSGTSSDDGAAGTMP